MDNEEIILNPDGSVTISNERYKKICAKIEENSPTCLFLLRKKEENIKRTIKYLESKRIRNLAIIDVNAVEGMLNE